MTLDPDDDKNPVIALREIAEGTVDLGELEDSLIRGLQKVVEADEPENDELDALGMQQQIGMAMDEVAVADEIAEDQLHIEGEDGMEVGDDEGSAFDHGISEED